MNTNTIFLLTLAGVLTVYHPSKQIDHTIQINSYEQAIEAIRKNATDSIYYRVIPALNNSFGYEIYKNKKIIIRQTSVPAQSGNIGFSSIGDAEKVAELVVQKMKQGINPPTVSISELQKLKIYNR